MKVQFVVVDSGPIIKGADLNSFSNHAVIVPGVIREIKDVKTRERIRNLPPYFLSIQSPSEQSIKHVRLVATKSGDIKVLSPVDIEVLAMSYELKYTKSQDQIEKLFASLNIDTNLDTIPTKETLFDFGNDEEESSDELEDIEDESDEENSDYESCDSENDLEVVEESHEEESITAFTMPLSDEGGWITAENFDEMRKTNFGLNKEEDGFASIEELQEVPLVGCLTTDFAMQNVLLHMDVTILSVNGMIVKEPRIFVSYCRSCFHKYRRVDIYFCPHCGNDNIGKVPAKISANGEMEIFLKKDFQPNLRNKIFSIPTPKGGKHTDGTHYIYCADQRVPDERTKKNKIVVDIGEDGQLPFVMHDFTTRSSLRGLSSNNGHQMRPSVPKGNKSGRRRKH